MFLKKQNRVFLCNFCLAKINAVTSGEKAGTEHKKGFSFSCTLRISSSNIYLRGINTNEENEGRMRERNFFEQPFEKWGRAFQQVETCDQSIPEWRESHKEKNGSINMKGTALPIPIYTVQI